MVLVLVVGGGSGWAAHEIRTQRAALGAMTRAGANLWFDYEDVLISVPGTNPPTYRAEPGAPAWVRRWLGDELFQAVTKVEMAARIDDTLMAHLARFRDLEALTLMTDGGEDRSLRHLQGLRRLGFVRLEGSIVADAALGAIGRIGSITSLDLVGASATDAGFAELAGLRGLTSLSIEDCPRLTDEGLARLLAGLPPLASLTVIGRGPATLGRSLIALGRHHPGLRELTLGRSRVTDADLIPLAGLLALEHLALDATALTDAGMIHLAPLHNLSWCSVGRTGVGDRGLAVVAGWPRLGYLFLDETRVTDAGLHALRGLPLGVLNLSKTGVTDAGLAVVGRIGGLKHLDLMGLPGVSDVGLGALGGLTHLAHVDLIGTSVSATGVAAWRGRLPALWGVRNSVGVPERPAPAALPSP